MHDGMPYGSRQGQSQSHVAWKLEIFPFLKSISSAIFHGSWQMSADS